MPNTTRLDIAVTTLLYAFVFAVLGAALALMGVPTLVAGIVAALGHATLSAHTFS